MSPEKEKYSLDDILNENYDSDETFSLESILAEYKRSAFIEGERKTPPNELDEQVQSIIDEVTGNLSKEDGSGNNYAKKKTEVTEKPIGDADGSDEVRSTDYRTSEETDENMHEDKEGKSPQRGFFGKLFSGHARENRGETEEKGSASDTYEEDDLTGENQQPGTEEDSLQSDADSVFSIKDEPDEKEKVSYSSPQQNSAAQQPGKDDDGYFESMEFADKIAKNVENPDWDFTPDTFDDEPEEPPAKKESFLTKLSEKFRSLQGDYEEEDEEPDPDYNEEIKRFSAIIPSLRLRMIGSVVLLVLMLVFTSMAVNGKTIPFGIGTNLNIAGGVVLVLQLLVMAAGIDILISGLDSLISIEPNGETLVLLSNVLSFTDGFIMLANRDFSFGMPLSVVASASLVFALHGRKAYYKAMVDSMKAGLTSNNCYGVVSEHDDEADREVLKKVFGKTKGFYRNLISEDVSEQYYFFATPFIIILGFILALLASVGSGRGESFAHCYAVIMVTAAVFPAVSAFALPFSYAASSLRKSGCALAGWTGACEIFDSDAAMITDEDVFPAGSVTISSIKVYSGSNQQKLIEYSASLIIASNSGLSRVFDDLLRTQGFRQYQVDKFSCYEGGGIGGLVNGENVLVGSGAFMNLMGIRVPDKINVANTIFAAVNDRLAVIYALNYVPVNSVQSALEALLTTRIDVLLAVKDFNVTLNTIQKKFKVSMEGVEYLPIEKSYKLSENEDVSEKNVAAVLVREGLTPLSETISKGKNLKTVTELNTAVCLAGSLIGMLLMFFLCKTGSFASTTPNNVFFFMMAVEIAVVLLSQLVKKRS